MAFEPRTLIDPETGATVVASSAKEFNNLRYGAGYVPYDYSADEHPDDTPEQPKPKSAQKSTPKNS